MFIYTYSGSKREWQSCVEIKVSAVYTWGKSNVKVSLFSKLIYYQTTVHIYIQHAFQHECQLHIYHLMTSCSWRREAYVDSCLCASCRWSPTNQFKSNYSVLWLVPVILVYGNLLLKLYLMASRIITSTFGFKFLQKNMLL